MTGASTHRVECLSHQGSVLVHMLTSSNHQACPGPLTLLGRKVSPVRPGGSELTQDQRVSPKGKPWPTQPGTPSMKAKCFSGVPVGDLGPEGTPRPMRG